jgi:hypothetical protein
MPQILLFVICLSLGVFGFPGKKRKEKGERKGDRKKRKEKGERKGDILLFGEEKGRGRKGDILLFILPSDCLYDMIRVCQGQREPVWAGYVIM